LDYNTFLSELARLDDVPLMMEHLDNREEYAQAAGYIKKTGEYLGIVI
jgi:hypothetical protein